MNNLVKELNAKEMNRYQFLVHIGIAIISIIGINGLIRNLLSFNKTSKGTSLLNDNHYGI